MERMYIKALALGEEFINGSVRLVLPFVIDKAFSLQEQWTTTSQLRFCGLSKYLLFDRLNGTTGGKIHEMIALAYSFKQFNGITYSYIYYDGLTTTIFNELMNRSIKAKSQATIKKKTMRQKKGLFQIWMSYLSTFVAFHLLFNTWYTGTHSVQQYSCCPRNQHTFIISAFVFNRTMVLFIYLHRSTANENEMFSSVIIFSIFIAMLQLISLSFFYLFLSFFLSLFHPCPVSVFQQRWQPNRPEYPGLSIMNVFQHFSASRQSFRMRFILKIQSA